MHLVMQHLPLKEDTDVGAVVEDLAARRFLTREQAEQHLTYYAEMLADRMEEGMSEEEAVAGIGAAKGGPGGAGVPVQSADAGRKVFS